MKMALPHFNIEVAVVQKCRSPVNLRLIFLSLIGLMMNMLASSSSVSASDSIKITREVLLESGRGPIVRALIQTKDGGYVVAGSDGHIPWATRTDAEGNVQWRHVLPMKEWTPGGVNAQYESGVAMADDSTLLCGYKGESEEPHQPILGLLARVDKAGKMLSHHLLYPQGDKSFPLNYLRQCVPWGDGFAVVGDTSRWVEGSMQRFLWLLALDANGDIKWEKLIPNTSAGMPLVTPNQDLVIVGPTQITRVDTRGTIKSQRIVKDAYKDRVMLVRSNVTDSVVRVLSLFNYPTRTLRSLGKNLEDLELVRGPGDDRLGDMVTNRAYLLPDRSLVLFGYQRESSTPTASITWISADLAAKRTFLPEPLWISGEITDALPTGKLGEFVTIRSVYPRPRWPDEKRKGLLMAFVRIK